MTDAISLVGGNSAASTSSGHSSTAITADTKKKLQALGLDPSKYKTEAQAQQALMQAQLNQPIGNCTPCTNCGKCGKCGSSNINSIKTEVQDLASKVGLVSGSNDKIDNILSNISYKINELQSSAGTDGTKLSEVKSYQSEYTSISDIVKQMEAAKNMMGASALANYNKAAQGLAT